MKTKYLSIGEFAKLCNVTRKALIFYDKEGIFSPEYKNEKGYRFYSINQYDTFSILKDLRYIGVTLEEIKEYLNNKNPNTYLELLKSESVAIDKRIEKLLNIKKTIENKINIVGIGENEKNRSGIYIKEFKERLLLTKKLEEIDEVKNFLEIIQFLEYTSGTGIYRGVPIGAILEQKKFFEKNYLDVDYVYIDLEEEINLENEVSLEIEKFQEGNYICINHIGSYETTSKSYKKLHKYIKENNIQIEGNFYEQSILDVLSVKDESKFLTRIMVKIGLS